jgi:hypothetical protein
VFGIRVISKFAQKNNHRARLGAVDIAGNWLCYIPLEDIVRRVESGINPAAPRIFGCVIQPRELEIERLPLGVQDHVKEQLLPANFHGESNAV